MREVILKGFVPNVESTSATRVDFRNRVTHYVEEVRSALKHGYVEKTARAAKLRLWRARQK